MRSSDSKPQSQLSTFAAFRRKLSFSRKSPAKPDSTHEPGPPSVPIRVSVDGPAVRDSNSSPIPTTSPNDPPAPTPPRTSPSRPAVRPLHRPPPLDLHNHRVSHSASSKSSLAPPSLQPSLNLDTTPRASVAFPSLGTPNSSISSQHSALSNTTFASISTIPSPRFESPRPSFALTSPLSGDPKPFEDGLPLPHHPALLEITARTRSVFNSKLSIITLSREAHAVVIASDGMPEQAKEAMLRGTTICEKETLMRERDQVSMTLDPYTFQNQVLSVVVQCRFYAGVPLFAPSLKGPDNAGVPRSIGTLAILYEQTRAPFSLSDKQKLRELAWSASTMIESYCKSQLVSSTPTPSPEPPVRSIRPFILSTSTPTSRRVPTEPRKKSTSLVQGPREAYAFDLEPPLSPMTRMNRRSLKAEVAPSLPPSVPLPSPPVDAPDGGTAPGLVASQSAIRGAVGKGQQQPFLPDLNPSFRYPSLRPASTSPPPSPHASHARSKSTPTTSPTSGPILTPKTPTIAPPSPLSFKLPPSKFSHPPLQTSVASTTTPIDFETTVQGLANSCQLDLVYIVSLDLEGSDGEEGGGGTEMKLIASASWGVETADLASVEPGMYLDGLRLESSGLMYSDPGEEEGDEREGKAVGISLKIWEEDPLRSGGGGAGNERRGFVLCGFTRQSGRELGDKELAIFKRYTGRLKSAMETQSRRE